MRNPLIGKSLILMGFLALFFGSAKAQSIIDRRYFTSYTVFPDVESGVADDRITNLVSGSGVDFRDKNPYGIVSVGFDPDMNLCYPLAVQYRIEVKSVETIIATPGTVTTQTNYYTFTISYDPNLQSVENEQAFVVVPNAREIELSIVSVKTVDNAGVETPVANPTLMEDDVYLQGEIVRERYFNFNPTLPASTPTMINSTLGNILTNLIDHNVHIVEWNNVAGAVEYEIEWTYVDDFKGPLMTDVKTPSEITVNFKNNASSVRVLRKTANKFFIPCAYSRGYVVWRVRAIGRGGPNLEDDIFGNWSTSDGNLLSAVPANHQRSSSLIGYTPGISNFNNVNSQYSLQFAEDGKLLASGLFADGSLRTRQNVTAVKIDEDQDYGKKAVITETIYDHMGRPAVTTLPAVTKNGLWYTPNYNLNVAGAKYSYKDFDTDDQLAGACVTGAEPMGSLTSGSANYYSTDNLLKTQDFQGLIAESNGYPFRQTIFERDNSGKPKVQSGPGIDHRMGGGHETKYIYGGAEAVQINRLFGTDAGYPEYYQKNMIVDPNGQISITYTDMLGRTVATALAGKVPDNMQPLLDDEGNPLATSGDIVNDDLLNVSDQHPNGSANPLSDDGKSYTLSKTLLIDKEQDYKFTYSVLLADFQDSCFTFCLDCIYDLELGLTDECGKYYIGDNDSTTSLKLTLPAGLNIDTLCNDTNAIAFPELVVHLKPGSYNLYKKLSINEAALSAYLDLMMANSDCLLPIDSFYVAPDTSGCYITCESCMANIGTWQDFFDGRKAAFNDDVLAEQTLRPVYNSMKAECDAICSPGTSYDFCESIYRLMLMDMAPGGQYAAYDDDYAGTVDAASYPLSILNTTFNLLPQKKIGQFPGLPPASSAVISSILNIAPSWRRPVFFDRNDPVQPYKAGYYDDMGQRERVYVQLDENDDFYPAVLNPAQVIAVDVAANQYYTFHENLKFLSDFLDNRPTNIAQSLVIYHPEFLQYSYCATTYAYTATVDGDQVNTFGFDQKLADMNYAQATALLGTNTTLSNLFAAITAADPFFDNPLADINYSPLPDLSAEALLWYRFQNFQTLVLPTSITAVAYIQNTCGYDYPTGCGAITPTVWGGQIHDDATWKTFASYYTSAKQEVLLHSMVLYGLFGPTPGAAPIPSTWNKVVNSCIGNDTYFPIFDLTLSPGTLLWENPCAFPLFVYYKQKQKRIGSTQSAVSEGLGLSDPPTLDELSQYATQGYYNQTGRCPMVADLEFLLGKLTLDRQSPSGPPQLTAPLVNLSDGGYMGSQLYAHIAGTGDIMYSPSIVGNTLSSTVSNMSCNTFSLTLPAQAVLAGYNFNDIQSIFGIHDIGQVGTDYSFTAKAIFYDPAIAAMPETLDLAGITCLPLTGCEGAFKAVCKPTDVAKDLMNLMSYISLDGKLFNATAYTLGSIPATSDQYLLLLTSRLRQYLGNTGPYTWQYINTPAPGKFLLTGPGGQLSLDLTGMGLTPGNTYQFTSILGAATSSPSSAIFSDFTLKAVQIIPGGLPPIAGAPGTPSYSVTGSVNVTGGSQTFPVTKCEPIRPLTCVTPEHNNLYTLQDMYQNWLNGILPQAIDTFCITEVDYPVAFPPANIQEIVSIEADMSQSTNGVNSEYFIMVMRMNDNSLDTLFGKYCAPLRNCVTCEDKPDTCRNVVFTISFPPGFTPQEYSNYRLTSKCFGASFDLDYVGYPSPAQYWQSFANYIEANTTGVEATVVNGTLVLNVSNPELLKRCPCDGENNSIHLIEGENTLATFDSKCCDPGPIPCQPHGIVTYGIAFPAAYVPQTGEEIGLSISCGNIKPSGLIYNHASISAFWTDYADQINTNTSGVTAFVRNDSLLVVFTDSLMAARCPCNDPENNIAVKGKPGTIVRIYANCCDPRPKACEPNGVLTFGIHFPPGYTPQAEERIYLSGTCIGIEPGFMRYEQASVHDFWEAYGNAIAMTLPGTTTFVRNDSLYIVITHPRILERCPCNDPENTLILRNEREEVLAIFKASCCEPKPPCVEGSVSFDFTFPPNGLREGETVYFNGNCFSLKPDSYVYDQGSEQDFWLEYGAELEANMPGVVTTYANGVLHVTITNRDILDKCPCNDPKNVITMTNRRGTVLATFTPQCCNGEPVRCETGGAQLYIPFSSFTMSPGDYFTINLPAFKCMGTDIAPLAYAHSDINSYLLAWAAQIEAAHPGTIGAEVSGSDMNIYFAPSLFNANCTCEEVPKSTPTLYKYDVSGNPNGNTSILGRCCEGEQSTRTRGYARAETEPEGGWDTWENPPITDDCHPDVFPFPQDPPLPNDCVQFLLETAQANAQYQYQQYLDQMREYYRQLYIAKCMDPVRETFEREFQDGQYHYTLYYYDRAGNLVKTVPPRAVTPLTGADLTAVPNARDNNTVKVPEHNRVATPNSFALTTRYRHNSLDQIIEQISPDAGKSNFYYDRLGRATLSRNAEQATSSPSKTYSYTLYDNQGRITEIGQMRHNTTATRAGIYNFASWATFFGYAYTKEEVTKTVYDQPSATVFASGFTQNNLRSRVSYSQNRPKGNANLVFTTYYDYDIHGNVKSVVHENLLAPAAAFEQNRVDYTYDLITASVKKVAYNSGGPDRFFLKYAYDDKNRMTEARSSRSDYKYDLDAKYFYFWHGDLARVELGQNKIQGVDYAYTIQGWQKSMNSDGLQANKDPGLDGHIDVSNPNRNFARDAYGYSLNYYTNDYTPIVGTYQQTPDLPAGYLYADLWNGNIAAMNNTLRNPNGYTVHPLLQRFGYDQLNRIAKTEAHNDFNPTGNQWPVSPAPMQEYATSYAYDPSGNIHYLNRQGNKIDSLEMDSLDYDYYPLTNRLRQVKDRADDAAYNVDIKDQSLYSANYVYNNIGNLIKDETQEIADIEWTVYGKVSRITRKPGSTKPDIELYYNATGDRVMKKIIPNNGTPVHTEYYVHDASGNVLAVYEHVDAPQETYSVKEQVIYGVERVGTWKSNLELYSHIPASPEIHIITRGERRYELVDHLNNVHSVVSDRKKRICGDGGYAYSEADIINANDYYAFGMQMPGRSLNKACLTHKFEFTFNPNMVYLRLTFEFLNRPTQINSEFTVNSVLFPTGTYATLQDGLDNMITEFNAIEGVYAYMDGSGKLIIHFDGCIFGDLENLDYDLNVSSGANSLSYTHTQNVPAPDALVASRYRFGFNGMEKLDEIYGDANAYDFGARVYDPRLGRWFAVDPQAGSFAGLSPYNFTANSPLMFVDPDGEKLILGGQVKDATNDIKNMVPAEFSGKIKVNSKGEVRIKLTKAQIKIIEAGNPDGKIDLAVVLIYNLTTSDKKYEYNVSDKKSFSMVVGVDMKTETPIREDKIDVDVFEGGADHGIENLSKTPYEEGTDGSWDRKALTDADGQLTMAPTLDAWEPVKPGVDLSSEAAKTGIEWQPKSRTSVVFHELSEMFYRTEGGEDGKGMGRDPAHAKAIEDEKSGNFSKASTTYAGDGATSARVAELKGTKKGR